MQGKELAEGSKQPVEWLAMILAMELALSLRVEDVAALCCRAAPWERGTPKVSAKG